VPVATVLKQGARKRISGLRFAQSAIRFTQVCKGLWMQGDVSTVLRKNMVWIEEGFRPQRVGSRNSCILLCLQEIKLLITGMSISILIGLGAKLSLVLVAGVYGVIVSYTWFCIKISSFHHREGF